MHTIKNITSYTHQGKREYQEDSFAVGEDFILVADGVGGLAKGNIASDLVARHWSAAITSSALSMASLQKDIATIVDDCRAALISYASEHPESNGMATTLACMLMIEGQYIVVHIGDSRVYHFGVDGHIKWRSSDHSLVQELVTAGVINEEEAANHPRKNVVTRVLQAKADATVEASIHVLQNVEAGDVFLVCTDGVTESWNNDGLSAIIGSSADNKSAINDLEQLCSENSSDNNTAVMATASKLNESATIIPVESNDDIPVESSEEPAIVPMDAIINDDDEDEVDDNDSHDISIENIPPPPLKMDSVSPHHEEAIDPRPAFDKRKLAILAVLLIGIIGLLYFVSGRKESRKQIKNRHINLSENRPTPASNIIKLEDIKKNDNSAKSKETVSSSKPTSSTGSKRQTDTLEDKKEGQQNNKPIVIIDDEANKVDGNKITKEEKDWQNIKENPSIKNVQEFLKAYPESKRLKQAEKLLKKLEEETK
jgi:serine/threonine protein phosphatase PrpC